MREPRIRLTDDMRLRLEKAVSDVAEMKSRLIHCEYCNKPVPVIVFDDTRGHIKVKCPNCRHEFVIEAVRFRRPGSAAIKYLKN